jgi:hypothetical protein
MNKTLLCLCGTAFVLLFTTASGGGLYKWKDAEGRLHYSDLPPTNVDGQKMKASVAAPAAASKSISEKEMEFRKRQLEAQEKAAKSDKQLAEAKDREKNCEDARGNLRSLEAGMRLAKHDAKGEQVDVQDNERLGLIEESKKAIATWCP